MLVANISGFMGNKIPPTGEFLDHGTSGAATNYSLGGINFGTATTDRLIVFLVSGHRAGIRSLISATIGGVSATINMDYSTSVNQISIFSAVVPTGTSGTIAFSYSADQADIRYAVYAVKGYISTTPALTDQIINTSTDPTSTISPAANTVVIAHAISYTGAGAGDTTWSGTASLTKYSNDASVNTDQSSAMKVFLSPGTNVTITASGSVGTTEKRMQVIGFN